MIRVIRAELRKLKRRSLSLATLATVTALTAFFTWIVYFRINEPANTKRGESITAAELSHSLGLVYGFKLVSFFLGITALCIFASQTAQEYTYGTLRNLLVRQPSRMKILFGKLASMKLFALVMVTLSAIVSIVVSYLMSGPAKVSTSEWFTASAFELLGRTFINVMITTVGFGIFGMILGLLFRSPITSISIGMLWILILENVLAGTLPASSKWLPGQNLGNIGEGGTLLVSYGHSLAMSAIYLSGGFAVVAYLFKRRDVAN